MNVNQNNIWTRKVFIRYACLVLSCLLSVLLLVTGLLFVVKSAEAIPENECQSTYKARIVSVYDGDTVRADINLGLNTIRANEPLRLYGINAPEVKGPERDRGIVSRDVLRGWIEGKEVTIRAIEDENEKFGRILVVIYVNGENINEKLVSQGLAEHKDY